MSAPKLSASRPCVKSCAKTPTPPKPRPRSLRPGPHSTRSMSATTATSKGLPATARAEEENTYKAMIAANLEREQRAVNDLRFAAATDAVDDEKRSAAEHAQDRLDELKERAEADLRSENPNLSPDAVREMTSREQAQYRTRLNDEYRERATAEINLRIRTHKNPNNQDDRQAYERSRSARESMYDAVSDELASTWSMRCGNGLR